MVNEKERIIKKLGINAEVRYPDGSTKEVKCLIGRASTIFNSMLSLEAHRKGDFLIADNVGGGCIVTNSLTGETYLVVATYTATFKDIILSRLAHMLLCNAKITVKRDERIADDNGNVKTLPVDVVSDLDIYVKVVDQQMRQYEPGLHVDAEYIIFSPAINVEPLDKILLTGYDSKPIPLKIVSYDNLTYPGISCIQVKAETRK